jgi:hypothetical protein
MLEVNAEGFMLDVHAGVVTAEPLNPKPVVSLLEKMTAEW